MKKEHIKIEISKLKANPKNPKKHRDDLIEEGIKELGFVDDIVIDEKNTILSGHGRINALKKLKYNKVDAIRITGWTEKQKEKYMLLANKAVEAGGWDRELLAEFDPELLGSTGFDSEELDTIFETETTEDNFDAEKEYAKIKEPKSKLGDIYQLGKHRLICGDSTQPETWQKLFGEEKAHLLFTDPPFNVGYDYWHDSKGSNFKKRQKGKRWGKGIFSDTKTPEEYAEFIYRFMANAFSFSKDDASFYCYYGTKNESLVRIGIEKAGWHISQTLIWLKPSLVISPGQDYHRIYEPCYFGWKKGKKHFINKKWGFKYSELILLDQDDFEEYLDILYEKRDTATVEYLHPTQKPVRLAERAIRRHSERGDIIAEPFNGSGSTIIAADQMKRICYAAEIDPKFVDVAIKRFEIFTHKKVKKL